MQRTLKRELKGPETDKKEALDICSGSIDTGFNSCLFLQYHLIFWEGGL